MAIGDFLSMLVSSNTTFTPSGSDVWMCVSVASGYSVSIEIAAGATNAQILDGATIQNKADQNLNCKILVTNTNTWVFNGLTGSDTCYAGFVQVA